MPRLPSLCSASFPPLLPRRSGPDLSHPFSRPPIRSLSCASLFSAVCWSVVVYQKHLLFSFPKSPHTRDNTHAHRCINIYIYTVYVYMNTKQANLWDAEARTRTLSGGAAGHVCVCASSCRWCSFSKKKEKKRKSTSLPRELSAIADLNPHRYLSAASSFWTAVAAVTKQVHTFFVFQEQTQEPQQSALGPFECIQCRVFTETGHKLGVHVNTVLPQNHASETGAGLTYDHSNHEWLFFVFKFYFLSLVLLGENSLQIFLFSFFFFHYKYINI